MAGYQALFAVKRVTPSLTRTGDTNLSDVTMLQFQVRGSWNLCSRLGFSRTQKY